MSNYKLAPSDFGFLWDECKRCFYLKVRRGFPRPSTPFPGIFTHIDNRMKDYYQGRRTSEIGGAPPEGVIEFGEKWVESSPVPLAGTDATCFVRGKFDTVLGPYEFDDRGVNKDQLSFLVQVQNAKRTIVWPKNVAESPLKLPY